jgi:chemotaxis protein histidine kinase CheA
MKQSPIAVTIRAEIAADSVASAARAFQVILVLQEVGEILDMEPSQSIIETAAPLRHFKVDFLSHIPLDELKKRIMAISEVEQVEMEPLKNVQVPQPVREEKAPRASLPQEQQRESLDLPEGVDIQFEISAEELPIFVAEAEEQIQVLDEGLVRLEQESEDEDLLQAVFRAAHTLKGAAGMIGHKRMVEVTHALESALDGLRKKQLEASSDLIDLCLEAVDAIRVLEEEIVKGKTNQVAVTPLVRRFESLKPSKEGESGEQEQQAEGIVTSLDVEEGQPQALLIQADISPLSVASAARAFQIILALKDLGDIVAMQPSREHIDRAANVKRFSIYFIPQVSVDEIQAALSKIDEIDRLQITSVAEDTLASFAAVSDEAPRTIQAEPATTTAVEQSSKNNVKASEKMVEQTVRTSVERLDNLMNLVESSLLIAIG